MPDYRRAFVPGGTFFFTLCTYRRKPLFRLPANVERLRDAVKTVKAQWPFEIIAAVILPDHLHWIWALPEEDGDFSRRIARIKLLFTKSLGREETDPLLNPSRWRHREGEVWQRRFRRGEAAISGWTAGGRVIAEMWVNCGGHSPPYECSDF
jgi:putative transposase